MTPVLLALIQGAPAIIAALAALFVAVRRIQLPVMPAVDEAEPPAD